MSVLFVLEFFHPHIGGVETLFKNLIDHLRARGVHCTVITSRSDRKLPKREQAEGLEIIRLPLSSRYLFTFFAFFAILGRVRKYDLVHTTSYNAGLPAFFGAHFFGKKVIITFHEAWGKLWYSLPFMSRFSQWGHYLFEQILLKLPFTRFVAVSDSTAQRLKEEGVSSKRLTTIHNGINYADFQPRQGSPSKEQPFTYTYFGRAGISKGLDLLLPAARLVADQLPDSRLQLITSRQPAGFLRWIKDYIRTAGIEEQVEIRHELPFEDLKKALQASHCVVTPSYSEGFCFAAVESIALGVPLVHSGRGALKEVVGGPSRSFSPFTSEQLAGALLKAAAGEWNTPPEKQFPLETTIAQYEHLYQELTENRNG